MAVVGHTGDGRAVIGPDLAHRVSEGLGAHALATNLGELGILDVIERVADGAEVEGDPIARLGAGGRHADGLGAVGGALGHGSAVLARERELEAIALRPVAALERLGEEPRGGDVSALGDRSVRVGERDGRAVLGHGAFGLGAVSPVNSSRVALGSVLGHGVARAHGQAGDGLLLAVLKREGRLAVRERHGVLALAEGAGDGLAVPVGQRDREAELALAVAAEDRLLDGEAALAGHVIMGRRGLGLVLSNLDRGGVGDVIDYGSFGGDLHVKAERARGACSLLAERPGKGARRGVVGGVFGGSALDVVNALGQDIGHRHVGRLRGALVVDAVIGPADGIGEGIAHAHRLSIHIDLGTRGVRLGDGLGVVVRREGVGKSLLAPLVGDLGLKAGTSLSHCDVKGVGMRIVLNQDIAACSLGHGRVVGTKIVEAELTKGNLAVLVVLRLDWVALEHIACTVGEGELKGEFPLLEAGLAATREHLGELGDGRRGGGGVEGIGESDGGDLVCRDDALGLGALDSVHRSFVASGGTFGHRVGSSHGQPRDPRRLAIFELEGRFAVLERRVTVGAGYFAARGIGGLDRKLKCLVRVDRQALARRDGLGDVELARLHSVGHGEAAPGVAGDLRAVSLDGVLGHGVGDLGAGLRVLGQALEGALPVIGLVELDRLAGVLSVGEQAHGGLGGRRADPLLLDGHRDYAVFIDELKRVVGGNLPVRELNNLAHDGVAGSRLLLTAGSAADEAKTGRKRRLVGRAGHGVDDARQHIATGLLALSGELAHTIAVALFKVVYANGLAGLDGMGAAVLERKGVAHGLAIRIEYACLIALLGIRQGELKRKRQIVAVRILGGRGKATVRRHGLSHLQACHATIGILHGRCRGKEMIELKRAQVSTIGGLTVLIEGHAVDARVRIDSSQFAVALATFLDIAQDGLGALRRLVIAHVHVRQRRLHLVPCQVSLGIYASASCTL